jgi:putative ABC transport system permease protein
MPVWSIRTSRNAAPALTRNIERFSQFLTLVGLTALIVGGVGIANSVRAWLEGKRGVIATLKCVGAPARLVVAIYLIQVMLIAGFGVFLGLALGAGDAVSCRQRAVGRDSDRRAALRSIPASLADCRRLSA